MSLLCKIFGHKFISTIYDCATYSSNYTLTYLNQPMCKRCGFVIGDEE